jgi:hypothetical protein
MHLRTLFDPASSFVTEYHRRAAGTVAWRNNKIVEVDVAARAACAALAARFYRAAKRGDKTRRDRNDPSGLRNNHPCSSQYPRHGVVCMMRSVKATRLQRWLGPYYPFVISAGVIVALLFAGQVAFTNDILLNNLALNSLFSAAYARYRMLEEVRPGTLYGEMPDASVRSIVGRPQRDEPLGGRKRRSAAASGGRMQRTTGITRSS